MERQANAMVRNAPLREIVRPDAFTPVPGSNLAAALAFLGRALCFLGRLVDTGAKNAKTLFTVLCLGFFILALGHDACGDMRHTHSRFRLVDILPAGTASFQNWFEPDAPAMPVTATPFVSDGTVEVVFVATRVTPEYAEKPRIMM